MKENVLKDKSYQFALSIISFYKYMIESKKEYILSKQILRSGTSIGAMVEEANQAESKSDFIHKLSVANKEANETNYWLRLLHNSDLVTNEHLPLQKDCQEIIRLLTSIIKSAKLNMKK